MASEMLDEYERINATRLARKSLQQIKIWRVRRRSALELFIQTIGGDCPLSELATSHTHRFRAYWQRRALDAEVKINSANRQIRQVAGLYKSIRSFHQLDGKNPFSQLRIPGGRDGKRQAYTSSFIQDRFLADGTFDQLNPEARRIVYLIIETGLRLSEACALGESAIHLDTEIPFVQVLDDKQETKTAGSVRTVPLVGVALLAMRAQPLGFPRYRNKPNQLSAVVGKVFAKRGLRPGGKSQTLYSLRHSLIDRLRAVEAPRDIQEDILGHVHLYGEGTSLEHRHRWLQRIALKPPSRV